MENQIVVIGPRDEKAKIAIVSLVVGMVAFALFLALALIIGLTVSGDDKMMSIVLSICSGIIALILLVMSIMTFITYSQNKHLKETPCLEYDKGSDEFIAHPVGLKEFRIKNGNIVDVSGSAFMSSRELKISYKDEKENVHKADLGFCLNIGGGALRKAINEYHHPAI